MAFNLKTVLLDIIEAAPAALEMAFKIKSESATASRTQLATDSLTAATGISEALLNGSPDEQQDAQVASQVAQGIINALATPAPTAP